MNGARVHETLKELGVEKGHIDAYLAAINKPGTFGDWSSFHPNCRVPSSRQGHPNHPLHSSILRL